MRKSKLYILALTTALIMPLSSCKETIIYVTPDDVPNDDIKTPIELSASNVQEIGGTHTRAAIIDGNGKITAFEKNTRLSLLMVSEDATTSTPAASKYTVTYGLAIGSNKAPSANDADGTKSNISFETTKTVTEQTYTDPTGTALDQTKSIADGDGSWRYWDDAHARTSQISVYGFAVNNTILPCGAPWSQKINGKVNTAKNGWETYTTIDYTVGAEGDGGSKIKWKIGDQTKANGYNVQSYLSLLYKDDLCYSNNLADYTSAGGSDARLKYHAENTPKFDRGELMFHHAMSILSFKVKLGDGFDPNSSDNFNFKEGTNIALKGFNKEGYLNIKEGKWDKGSIDVGSDATFNGNTGYSWWKIGNITEGKTINQIDDHTYYLMAMVIPGTDIKNSTISDAVTFIIDNNEYKISMKQLYDALIANKSNWRMKHNSTERLTESDVFDKEAGESEYVRLKSGMNYEFTFTVGKTKINAIKAQLADWEMVEAEPISPKVNTVSVSTSVINDHFDSKDYGFDLYRLPYISTADAIDMSIKNYSWTGRYTDKATLTGPTDNVWGTNWYFESNKHFYHFRAVSPKAVDPVATTVQTGSSPADDYLNLVSASITTSPEATYNDVLWGAPFSGPKGADNKYSYDLSSNGFDGKTTHQIHEGIPTTESTINLLLFHMMSEVTFNVTTTTGAEKVLLQTTTGEPAVTKNTKVELINYCTEGTVLMGNGLVKVKDSSKSSESSTAGITLDTYTAEAGDPVSPAKSVFRYGAVPQSLAGVVLRITTPDDNRYEVNLANVLSTSVTTNNLENPYPTSGEKYQVNSWYPGVKYTYNFILKKTGIEKIIATVVDWENITADDEPVQIK